MESHVDVYLGFSLGIPRVDLRRSSQGYSYGVCGWSYRVLRVIQGCINAKEEMCFIHVVWVTHSQIVKKKILLGRV